MRRGRSCDLLRRSHHVPCVLSARLAIAFASAQLSQSTLPQMSVTLLGSVRLCTPASPRHCLLDARSSLLRVQVHLRRVDPLAHDDTQAATRGISIEAVINHRVKPTRWCAAQREETGHDAADPRFSFAFSGVTPGRYHLWAFTLEPTRNEEAAGSGSASDSALSVDAAAAAAAAAYTNPATQAFGFYSGGHAHGNTWPWTMIEVGGGGNAAADGASADGATAGADSAAASGDVVIQRVPEFAMRVPHSFQVLRGENPAVPTKTTTASLRLLSPQSGSLIPVLRLGATSPRERGYNHGYLLAPYIVDFWRFYLLESRFCGNVPRYESFVRKWVRPDCRFFRYPESCLDEAAGVVEGMCASGISMFIEELHREFNSDDILAGYIETRSVVATESEHWKQQQKSASAAADSASEADGDPKAKTLSHHCSQAVLWGEQTGGTVFAGRNMDGSDAQSQHRTCRGARAAHRSDELGVAHAELLCFLCRVFAALSEIDIRKVTASHSILIATERDSLPAASPAPSFRVISLMWPGLIGTLTGINETGLYICENAGESQPDTDLISGLTPVSCVQWAALRTLDGRGLTAPAMRQFLSQYISHTGWDHALHCPTSAEAHVALMAQRAVPQYASDTQGGFSGPGSIFVVATPPTAAAAPAKDAAGSSDSSSSSVSAVPSRPCHGFVVEADRCHTVLRLPSQAPPHDVADCILATNHALALGYDDVGVVSRVQEGQRSATRAMDKCASLSPLFGGAAASGRQTNWNVPIAPKSYWRFEAGRNALQALSQERKQQAAVAPASGASPANLSLSTLQHLLQVMCPGYTEHSMIGELRADGSVYVHVAVADLSIGQWAAPYAPWVSFEFGELFRE